MAARRKHRVLYIITGILLVLVFSVGGYAWWLSRNYKQVLMERLPKMVTTASDSIYHLSIKDISVDIFRHKITIYGAHLWADSEWVKVLRQQNRYSPNTISFVYIPRGELYGVDWDALLTKKTFSVRLAVARDAEWFMQTIKHEKDLSNVPTAGGSSKVNRMTIGEFDIINPDVTYHFVGLNNHYKCYLKGGRANLYDWAVDADVTKDTSVFLYAKYGSVRPKTFRFEKDDKVYTVENPNIDFKCTDSNVTLKNLRIEHMTDISRQGALLETYTCRFPALQFNNLNWKKLLHYDVLTTSAIHAASPYVDVHYNRLNFPGDKNKTGSFPNQIIKEFIPADIRKLYVKNGRFLYNEPNSKNENALFQFDDINGTFDNITNVDSIIRQHKNCIVKLSARFMNKSPVEATFDLSLADPKGHFVVTGSVRDLNGDDVSQQAADFTIAKVTSFHLTKMDGRVEGDESHAHGDFTMLYDGLKISLFKFKSDERKTRNGPFSFIADATILYPSNPMPNKDVRTATTDIKRDPNNGFIFLVWESMYLGAQKSAVRDARILLLAGGDKEDKNAAKQDHKVNDKDEPKKKGFFARLFGRKKK